MKNRCLKILLSLLVAFLMIGNAAQGAPMQLLDENFQNGLENWITTVQSGQCRIEAIEENENRFACMETADGSCYLQKNISGLCPGDRVSLSFRQRIQSLSEEGYAAVKIDYCSTNGEISGYTVPFYELTGTNWVEKELDLLIPEGVEALHILFRLVGGGTVGFDDIVLSKAGAIPSLTVSAGGEETEVIPEEAETLTVKLRYTAQDADGGSARVLFALYQNDEEVSKELLELKTITCALNGELYAETSLPLPRQAEKLSVEAFIWDENLSRLKPLTEHVQIGSDKRSTVFKRFQKGGMRGAYGGISALYKTDMLDALLEAGCNTFIFNIIGTFYDSDINKDAEALAKVCKDAEAFAAETEASVFMKASFGARSVVSNTSYGKYEPGAEHDYTLPCPLSMEYWEKEMLSRLLVVAQHPGITGAVFDMEMYSGGRTNYPNPCFCDTCTAAFAEKEGSSEAAALTRRAVNTRRAFARQNGLYDTYTAWFSESVTKLLETVRERLHTVNPNLILGYMPQLEWLPGITKGLGTEEMPVMIFDENTYKGRIGMAYMHLAHIERDRLPAVYTAGLWSNEERGIIKADFAEKIKEAAGADMGYWMYSIENMEEDAGYFSEIEAGNQEP